MTARLDADVQGELDSMLGTSGGSGTPTEAATAMRQPVHTVYVPADRYEAELPRSWGTRAAETLATYAPDAASLAHATGMSDEAVAEVLPLMGRKLATEPIEDLRVDFEDGLAPLPDADEDALARHAGQELARAVTSGICPPFAGIRFASLEPATRRRGVRTLDLFLGAVVETGAVPEGLVVTLPKVTSVAQVEAMDHLCGRLETAHGLPAGRLRFEVQVEMPQAILGADGTATVARMVHAASRRLTGLHYGTYDYSAACGIAAEHQSLEHPAADHAKAVMQLAVAGTGVRISDGSTNVLPVGDGATVCSAWELHARLVRRALQRGFYQGWDLHPAQLPTRFLATYAFFRATAPSAVARLRAYRQGREGRRGGGDGDGRDGDGRGSGGSAGCGGSSGSGADAVPAEPAEPAVIDEPATARALAGYLLRGVDCGALTEDDVGVPRGDLLDIATGTGMLR
ncbi:aldolase [Actinobacteria bacterium YIM 96077]|uniref:Aldolase n=1 Tax=Phytoactinopolyspora halophila TaxID=1981511 RepID=A0A329R2L0_9ACTN|nr:aldolase/citrate lyase family protein [Phytoactinopolyspora halophila]AYY11883.1 aldolase [Actinobacteria bacterium YIM 96077]RAW18884.1 aldolase [Phytoactinopolyspora halophila]